MWMLLSFLKSKLAAFAAVIIIILVLVIGGPMIFGSRWRLWFYLAALLVLVVFLIYLGIKAWQARRKARLLEGFLQKQAQDQVVSSRPESRDDLAALKEKLDKAIAILKRSRLARGRRGAEALYLLPWYMIIGPSAAGKSTALRNSGLHFPPVDPDSADPGRVKGLGGTRNCDWWFSNEGVILDTAGRYTVASQGPEDAQEWGKFLDLLRKARPRAPINGLILAVAMDDVIRKSDEELRDLAKTLRARVDELIVKLEILFPVYVVFTKCDLVAGFTEFFGDYDRDWREQVWGYTRKYESGKAPLQDEFAAETGRLRSVLEQRRLRQMATEVRPANKRGIYLFPLEFDQLRARLIPFIETLFAANPYQQSPPVRGFYFTSGTQEGSPIGQVMEAMRRDYGLVGGQSLSARAAEPKPFFIRDLFQEVILPDESKVRPTSAAEGRRRMGRLIFYGAAAAFAVLSTFVFLNTHIHNRRQIARLAADTGQIMAATSAASGFSLDILDSLETLRGTLELADRGPGFFRRWGLYFGDRPLLAAQQAYFHRLRDVLIEPTARKLEDRLHNRHALTSDQEKNDFFQLASAYRMLVEHYDSTYHNAEALYQKADSIWRPTVPTVEQDRMEHLLSQHLHYYWQNRPNAQIRWLRVAPDRALLTDIDRIMDTLWTVELLFQLVVNDANAAPEGDFTMLNAAPGSIRVSGGSVGHAYTKDGWEKYVQKRIKNLPEEIAANPALKEAFGRYSDDKIRELLTSRYADEFRRVWRVFIQSAQIVPLGNLTDATGALDDLAQPTSPIVTVLKAAYQNSQISIGGKFEDDIRKDFNPIGLFLGDIEAEGGGDPAVATYLKLLAEVPPLAAAAAEQLQTSGQCAMHLKRLSTQND